MFLLQVVQHFLLWLRYRNAEIVNSHQELTAAMRRMPPRIVVEGDEALRTYAAALVERDAGTLPRRAAAAPAPGEPPIYMVVPTLGRIRDGYRKKPEAKRPPFRLKGGLDSVLVAGIGIFAALLLEWLSYPDLSPRMVRGPHRPGLPTPTFAAPNWHLSVLLVDVAVPLLGTITVAAAGCLIWQALGLSRPLQTRWRLEQRVQGRLVMARVRTRGS